MSVILNLFSICNGTSHKPVRVNFVPYITIFDLYNNLQHYFSKMTLYHDAQSLTTDNSDCWDSFGIMCAFRACKDRCCQLISHSCADFVELPSGMIIFS